MINYATYRKDNTNNELNPRFRFVSFNVENLFSVLSITKSVAYNLFSVDTFQIQLYTFQGEEQQKQTTKGRNSLFVLLVEDFVNQFDTLPRNFKTHI